MDIFAVTMPTEKSEKMESLIVPSSMSGINNLKKEKKYVEPIKL